jgi:hypothetical protein
METCFWRYPRYVSLFLSAICTWARVNSRIDYTLNSKDEVLKFANLRSNGDESAWGLAVTLPSLVSYSWHFPDTINTVMYCVEVKTCSWNSHRTFISAIWGLKYPLWQFVTASSHQLSSLFDRDIMRSASQHEAVKRDWLARWRLVIYSNK